MTDDQALSIYRACFPGGFEHYSMSEAREIIDEAGGRLIEWWGCWGPRNTATMAARKIRRRAAKSLGESA